MARQSIRRIWTSLGAALVATILAVTYSPPAYASSIHASVKAIDPHGHAAGYTGSLVYYDVDANGEQTICEVSPAMTLSDDEPNGDWGVWGGIYIEKSGTWKYVMAREVVGHRKSVLACLPNFQAGSYIGLKICNRYWPTGRLYDCQWETVVSGRPHG